MSPRLRRLLNLLAALVMVLFAAAHLDWARLEAALARASIAPFVSLVLLMQVVVCAADALALRFAFRVFGLRLPYWDLYVVRAASYVLSIINYHAGQLSLVAYARRVAGVSIARAGGWMIFISAVWAGWLVLFTAVGMLLLGGPQARALLPVVGLCIGLAPIYAWMLVRPPRWLRAPLGDPDPAWGWLRRRAHSAWAFVVGLCQPLIEAGLGGHVRAGLARFPHFAAIILWDYFGMRCFHIQVPLLTAVLYLPAAFAVGALPTGVFSLPMAQVTRIFLFSRYSPDGAEGVLACSFVMTGASLLANLGMGLLFLQRGTAVGFGGPPPPPPPPIAG